MCNKIKYSTNFGQDTVNFVLHFTAHIVRERFIDPDRHLRRHPRGTVRDSAFSGNRQVTNVVSGPKTRGSRYIIEDWLFPRCPLNEFRREDQIPSLFKAENLIVWAYCARN